MSDALDTAIAKIIDEGRDQIHTDGLKDHMDTLAETMFKVCMEGEVEVRLTYKTTAQAAAAWAWMIVAIKRVGMYDNKKSSAFDIELTNDSGIMFWTDEGRPNLDEKGTGSVRAEEAQGASAAR